jgi:hypothetical protein
VHRQWVLVVSTTPLDSHQSHYVYQLLNAVSDLPRERPYGHPNPWFQDSISMSEVV